MHAPAPSEEKTPVHPGELPAWEMGDMPAPAPMVWRNLLVLLGPGIVLAGSSLGTGEWISGAAIAALYRGALLWVAPLAILCQVVLNTEVMRYTLVTGEPMFTGFMRSRPGPRFWLGWYILLDCLSWWPSLAGLTAQILAFTVFGMSQESADQGLISMIGCGVLLLSALLLCFGGKIYNTLEVVLGGKVLFVLGYMTIVTLLFVPWSVWTEVTTGMLNPLRVPADVDWSLVGIVVGFAGIGGMGNILASNYVREKGWGMGARVGAIASAFGGHKISLSHIGTMSRPTEEGVRRFRLWWKQVQLDQFVLWTGGSLIGMLLPCLLGAAYLKDDYFHGVAQWKAAVAMATDFGSVHGVLLLNLTLVCGFVIMFPGTISSMDGIARRWCDALWSGSRRARAADGHKVKYLYYSFIGAYLTFGLVAFGVFGISAPKMMKISGNMANLSIMCCILHTLYVNTRFLPREFRPSPAKRAAMVMAALFYLSIFTLMMTQTLPRIISGEFFRS